LEKEVVKAPTFLIACGLTLFPTLLMRASTADVSGLTSNEHSDAGNELEAHRCGGEPCRAVERGLRAFFDRKLDGLGSNGRACADCHMATDHFQLSPADAEARFQRLQIRRERHPDADDPLFRPIDADDFRTNGDNASDFSNLRQNGLVRISFPLPPNMRLIDPATNAPSAEAFVDVWRSVPTVNDVALTGPDGVNPWPRGPNVFGGYQLDGRVATLQEQALGALTNHAQIQNAPRQRLLDDLSSFQRVLFTNHRVRALADAVRESTTPLPDPDPRLDDLEKQGKAVFERACSQCHGGPGQSTAQAPVIRFHDISSQCPRPVDAASPARFAFAACPARLARNARTYEITLPDRSKIRRTSSDPGRALLTGFVGGVPAQDDWNKFDVPGLRGIRKTAPYFHNNSAATLEEVVDHYIEFFKRVQVNAAPGVVPPLASTDGVHFDRRPTPEERGALLAYLRKL
jgi:cytochrome c peroxidase